MIRPRRYFPWKLAREVYFFALSILAVLLVLIGFSIRFRIYRDFAPGANFERALSSFDSYLISLLFTIFGFGVVLFLWHAKRYAQPLGRLIQRARELRRLDLAQDHKAIEEFEAEAEPIEDPGEWSDLERVLNRFHRDLRTRTIDLAREREELKTLIGAVSDAIFAVDRAEEPLFYNAQFATLFRISGQGSKALSLGEIFRVPEVLAGYREVLKTGDRRLVAVNLHTNLHALPRHFSISIAPLKAHDEAVILGAIGVFHDITELKQSEQIRIEFVANASHELRTPLTNVKGYVDTLREDLKSKRYDGAEQFMDIISRNVDRLTLLVSDLLDLSTLESGAELVKSPLSTLEVTDGALRQLDAKRSAKKQVIETHIQCESVRADPRRLEQVIVNLVHNAIKYTPEGSRIDIYWEKTAEGVIFRVHDNGPGIALEHQPRLFERFYRVDAGRSREQGGTGLGLAIVKHIMIKHGGTARVQSRSGEGSEFICLFPL